MSRTNRSSRQAGARFETAVAKYLAWALDDQRVERRHLSGAQDRGDITGVMFEGRRVVIECKDTARPNLAEHTREAALEAENDGAAHWALVHKRHGIGLNAMPAIGAQWVTITLAEYAKLLNHGHIGPQEPKEGTRP